VSDGNTPQLIWAIMATVLVASSLMAYRLPLGKMAKMAAAWVGIFGLVFIIMTFRPEMKMIWERFRSEIAGAPLQQISGDAIRLTRKDDGHFWITVNINDRPANFMIDSGASITAINADQADALKLDWRKAIRSAELNTANGTVRAKTISISSVTVGDFKITDHTAVVAEEFGDTNVVGMNFLDAFSSWNVEGDVMTLKP
jgi:aspartyl protease family protein